MGKRTNDKDLKDCPTCEEENYDVTTAIIYNMTPVIQGYIITLTEKIIAYIGLHYKSSPGD